MNRRFDISKPMQVGGQAVLEGVMMRAPGMVATAVRRASGEIVVNKEQHISLGERNHLFRLPIIRGALGLIEMMYIGIRTLNYSAEVAFQDASLDANTVRAGSPGMNGSKKNLALAFTAGISLLAGIAIFFVTPLIVTTSLFSVEQDPLTFNLIAGGIRIALLLSYLLIISTMKEVKRLFQYHGAEHKAVFAFERGDDLEVSAAARQSRFHPRCGTSFLLIVMIVAIVLFSVLDTLLIGLWGEISIFMRLATHLPLLPVIGGISYEFIKASAKRSNTAVGRIIVAPGLWLQKITTREPDEQQLEVALAALRCALGEDYSASPTADVFSSHEALAK
jgi:uncharacterized protein YqhQ